MMLGVIIVAVGEVVKVLVVAVSGGRRCGSGECEMGILSEVVYMVVTVIDVRRREKIISNYPNYSL